MLLTPSLRRVFPLLSAFVLAAASPVVARLHAQGTGGGAPDSAHAAGPQRQRPVWSAGSDARSPRHVIACRAPVTCPASSLTAGPALLQREPAATRDQRGKFALIGLVTGAAVGWGVYAYQCTHGSDCYSPVGGVLLATAGGAIGLLVGLLLAPGPASP